MRSRLERVRAALSSGVSGFWAGLITLPISEVVTEAMKPDMTATKIPRVDVPAKRKKAANEQPMSTLALCLEMPLQPMTLDSRNMKPATVNAARPAAVIMVSIIMVL